MRWTIEQGLKRKPPRKPTPDQLKKLEAGAPLDAGTMILVRAYADVSTCRSFGMGMGPIPITAIWEWCDRQCSGAGLEPDVVVYVIRVLRLVDHEIISRQNRKSK